MTFSDLLQIYKNLTLKLIQSHSKIARTLNKYFYKMNYNIIFPVCVNVSETLFVMAPRSRLTLEDHTLSAIHGSSFNILRATLHVWRLSVSVIIRRRAALWWQGLDCLKSDLESGYIYRKSFDIVSDPFVIWRFWW